MRRLLNPEKPSSVSDSDLTEFKLNTARVLSPSATAVLLDPQFGAAQAIAASVLTGRIGLVVALEATGYGGDVNARQSRILPGWSVEKAKRMGASMVKLLVYYHPQAPNAAEIESLVRKTADDCIRFDICFMLEPLTYPLDPSGKPLDSTEMRELVVESARNLTCLGVDLLKAEFPLASSSDESEWSSACAEVSNASQAPWILLSGAVDYPTYVRQVRVACEAGASGVAAGRAVWQEAVNLQGMIQNEFLQVTAYSRLARLTSLCDGLARPWTDFYGCRNIESDWFIAY